MNVKDYSITLLFLSLLLISLNSCNIEDADFANTLFEGSQIPVEDGQAPGEDNTIPDDAFVTVWNSANEGISNDNQITIPATGTYRIIWQRLDDEAVFGVVERATDSYLLTLPEPGEYRVGITGGLERIHYDLNTNFWDRDQETFTSSEHDNRKLLRVEQWGEIRWRSMHKMFVDTKNLIISAEDIPDLSQVRDMSAMFYGADGFNSDLSRWDVSNVENMAELFAWANSFNQPLNGWDVRSVKSMSAMFFSSGFDQPIGDWDVSSVTNMRSMFQLSQFNQPIGDWDVSNVTQMGHMLNQTPFDQPIENWDVSSVENFRLMFAGSSFNQALNDWDVNSARSMQGMFHISEFDQPIGNWDVSNVENMTHMFLGAAQFNQDISNWNVENVREMASILAGAERFDQNLSKWRLANIVSSLDLLQFDAKTGTDYMFDGSGMSRQNYDLTLAGWAEATNLARDLTIGASGLIYCNTRARNQLIERYNWEFDRDRFAGEECLEDGEVYNPETGRIWMNRNLGASRVAQSSKDELAYGDLYQWGRAADGHEKRNSGTRSTLSGTDQPGHGDFILAPNSPNDWRSPQNDNLWQGLNGINNPCPEYFRLPTHQEFDEELKSWISNDAEGAFSSPLRLPVTGNRHGHDGSGSLLGVGSNGHYWSNTADGTLSRNLYFSSSTARMGSNYRAFGYSVRCIKD